MSPPPRDQDEARMVEIAQALPARQHDEHLIVVRATLRDDQLEIDIVSTFGRDIRAILHALELAVSELRECELELKPVDEDNI